MDPTSVSDAIIIGVISGVVANVLLSAGTAYFQKVILPEFRRLRYRGIIIDGSWEVIGDTEQLSLLTLKQNADDLKGDCAFILPKGVRSDLYEQYRNTSVSGFIRDRFVELSFRHEDPSRIGAGVFLLEVIGDGRRMQGHQTFYSVGNGRITSARVLLQRYGPRGETGNIFDDEDEKASADKVSAPLE